MGEDGERMSPEEVAEAIRSGTMVSQLLHFGDQKKTPIRVCMSRDTKERGLETKFLRNFCVKHSAL